MPTDPRVVRADNIDSLLEQYDVPAEFAERLRKETTQMRRPSQQEILPPNIPVDPQALKERLEQGGNPRDQAVADGLPPGHPGVDYHDSGGGQPTNEAPPAPTSQGKAIPDFLNP
jgi:hypothetical protein